MADVNISEFTASLREATNAARELARQHSNMIRTASREQADALRDINEATDSYVDSITKGVKLSEKELKLKRDVIAEDKKHQNLIKEVNELTEKLAQAIKDHGEASAEAAAIQQSLTTKTRLRDAAASRLSKKTNMLEEAVGKLGKGAKISSTALTWFAATLTTQGRQLMKQYQAAGGVIEGSGGLFSNLFSQQVDAIKMGLTGEDLQKISSSHRQTINSMGGTTEAFKTLTPAVDRFRILTGDSAKAAEMAAKAAQHFAMNGVQPSARAINAYTSDLVELTRRTGLNAEQAAELYSSVSDDIESRDILRAARADEREAILASQRALVQQAIAAGMSAEQAKEAAKMLNKMVAAKPLDRLKQAAKIRAMGGAMGIAGAEEAAQAVIAGKRATAAQQQAMSKFGQDMANAMDKSASQGLGTEIFASTLLEKMGLEEQYGKGSPFSTSMGESLKPTESAINNFKDMSLEKMGESIGWLIKIKDALGVGLSGNMFGGVIASAVVAGVTTVFGRGLLDKLGGLVGRGGGSAGGGAGGSKTGKAGKLLKNAGKGGLVGLGVMGAQALAGEESTVGKVLNSNAVSGAGYGAMIGSVIPGVGTVVGGAVGGAIGGAMDVYDWATKPSEMTPMTAQRKKEVGTELSGDEEFKTATLSTADGITKQLAQMDESNAMLKQLTELAQRQLELTEKQLVAATLSEREKTDVNNRSKLMQGSKFGSSYNYV